MADTCSGMGLEDVAIAQVKRLTTNKGVILSATAACSSGN